MPSQVHANGSNDLLHAELVRLLRVCGFPVTETVSGQIGAAATGVDLGLVIKGVSLGVRVVAGLRGRFSKHLRQRRRKRIPDYLIMIETGFLPDVVRPLIAVLPDIDAKLKENFPALRCSYQITAARSATRPATVRYPTDMLNDSLAIRTLFKLDAVADSQTVHIGFHPKPWWRLRPRMEVCVHATSPTAWPQPEAAYPAVSDKP